MLMLLLLFFSALLFFASLSSFFPWYVPSRSACPALRVAGLAALSCSLAGFEAMVCVAWVGADATGRCVVLLRVLLARTSVQSRPFPLHGRGCRPLYLPVVQPGSSLGRRDGWRPEREADSSANSASLDRRTGHMRGELFFRNSIFFYFSLLAYCRFFGLLSEGSRGRDRLVVSPSLCLLVLLVLVSW